MNLLILLAALYLAVRFGDRLRLVNWRSVRPLYVGLYLCGMLWNLGVIYATTIDISDEVLRWLSVYFRCTGMVAFFCLLEITKHSWSEGVPEAAKSAPAPLDGVHQ